MTLREFISTYNFRSFFNDKENTQIIRIIDDYDLTWFEFGVDDWNFGIERNDFVESIFKEQLLDRTIESITYGEITEVVEIHINCNRDPKEKETPKK